MCLLYGWDRGDKGHQRCWFSWALGRLNSLPIYWHCCIFLRRSSLLKITVAGGKKIGNSAVRDILENDEQ
jgi:hypothetical protein